VAIAPDAGTTDKFTFYYYAPLNAFGPNYATLSVIIYDGAITADTTAQLPSYPVESVTISIEPVNQPPTISLKVGSVFQLLSGSPSGVSVSSTIASSAITKALQFQIADPDVENGLMSFTISTSQGKLALTASNAFPGTKPPAPSSSITYTGVTLLQINNMLASVLLTVNNPSNSPSPITVTVSIDDNGNTGAVNPRCPGHVTTTTFTVKAVSGSNVQLAAAGAAIGASAVAALVGAAALGAAYLLAHRKNILDTPADAFGGDDLAAAATMSPAYTAATMEMGSPVWASKEAIGGAL